jgi:hypothetical protein
MASLPSDFVVKARHSAGCTLIVKGGVVVTHHTCNGGREWLRTFFSQNRLFAPFVSDRFLGRQADKHLIAEVTFHLVPIA